MNRKQIGIIVLAAAILVGAVFYFAKKDGKNVKQIQISNTPVSTGPENQGDVSPISGLACDNWNKRPIAVMQPADPSARPAAGFSDADMMFEMPVFTNSNTRLMGVYVCNLPAEVGSLRSARHDNIPLAKGLDAIFVHWGYSKFAQSLLEQKNLDNINCLTTSFCERWPQTGMMKYEDTGFIKKEKIQEAIQKYGYRAEGNFSGYPHQAEKPLDQRPEGGNLRIAFPGKYDVEYDYDKASNSYLRTWDGEADIDKNNKQRVAPKNVVVMVAESEQIKLATDYKARGVQDPWLLVPQEERQGLDYGGVGRYNNLQMGDPWFDTSDGGAAAFYFDGRQQQGTWKKDRSKLDSKLFFYDQSGQEIRFVPGQIWVDVVEPTYTVRWTPVQ